MPRPSLRGDWSGGRVPTPQTLRSCRNGRCPSRPGLSLASTSAQAEFLSYGSPSQFNEEGGDYYSILGVSPTAPQSSIKTSYYNTIRECHPDLTGVDENEATEFCIFLNEIYETLSDPEKREEYDMLMGFTKESINPFRDTGYALDQVFVDEFTCIGCRNCTNVCGKTFELEDDYGRARVVSQRSTDTDTKQEAIDTCPVDCIHWVSAPQLALLEVAMQNMERVHAWLLNTGGGSSVNVFQEASLAWQKRKARAQTRGTFSQGGWQYSPAAGAVEGKKGASTPRQRMQYHNMLAAAEAARRWRDYQRNKSAPVAALLPETSTMDAE
ncbi:hypothetical protein WJX73_003293 [Symbiochloris irregularis]|uniref:Uncharacterized protein n=1 Tax=Symbiochloris irregularis TaxID=706552 RepID=A0AAW1NXB0_9CHLO